MIDNLGNKIEKLEESKSAFHIVIDILETKWNVILNIINTCLQEINNVKKYKTYIAS